jgi:HAE1 family hydrophobic/amphiphilic exporter-1
VLVALIILWGRGDSLNIITLGGLTIAIGRVIDDSIVVLENSYRHLQEGDDIETATLTATKEVSRAITASTITTVAVFLPLGFTHGIASEFFRPFALTVTFALLASLLVALTVVPVAVTWFLSKRSVGHREADEETRLQRAYLPVLRLAIGHKAVTIVAALAVFVGSLMLVPLLKTNLLDSSAGTTISMTQQMPPGTDLVRTERAAAPIEAILKTTPGIDTYQVTVGSTGDLFGPGGGTNASSAQAQYTVVTDGLQDKGRIIDMLRARIARLRDVGDVAVTSGSDFGGSEPIEVRIYGEDPTALREANRSVLATVRTVPDLANISSNLSESRPEIAVTVNTDKAAAAGADPSSIAQVAALALSGSPAGVLPTATGPLSMTLALPPLGGDPLAALRRLPVPTATGVVPLGAVASITQAQGPAQVTHTDGQRTVTVQALPTSNNVGQTSTQIKAALKDASMPPGTRWEIAGASEQMNEVFRQMGIAMLIAILLVYIIMVATFSSLLNPLILLVSIPFAAVGAIVLLFITGTSLGMPSLIGLLMLIGIVVTNAIVLLDLIEQFRRRGFEPHTAVVEGARRRLRPILMTAVATILALIPMAVGPALPRSWHLGESAFLSTPLAVVVIGGLFSSTVLTLILVPVIYLAVEPLRRRRAAPAEIASATARTRAGAPEREPAGA